MTNPVTVQSHPIRLVGISTGLPPRSAAHERPRVIQEISRSFLSRVGEIPNRLGGERYSLIENDVRENGKAPIIRVMVAVDSFEATPAWCERFTLEPGRYAVFEHQGPPRELGKTVTYIHANWTAKIPGLFRSDLEIFVYPAGYDPTDPKASFGYWLPLNDS